MSTSSQANESLSKALKQGAAGIGFDLVGATPARRPPRLDRFERWLADGYSAGMHYLAARAGAYRHPRHVLRGVRSILVLAVNYTVEPAPTASSPAPSIASIVSRIDSRPASPE